MNGYQAEHDLLREVLRRFLVAKLESSRGAGVLDQVVFGAVAALDSLLAAHPVDRRGRCRSCRGSGWSGRRRSTCIVYVEARYWLRQPTHRLQAHLAAEFGLDVTAQPSAADPEATEVLPKVADDPSTDPLQTPAVPPTPTTGAGRPDRDHGGAGVNPDSPRLRRGPSDEPPPDPAGRRCSLEA